MVTAASLASLPAQGKVGTFYLVRNTASSGNNLYTEYIWTGTEYEETGANVLVLVITFILNTFGLVLSMKKLVLM